MYHSTLMYNDFVQMYNSSGQRTSQAILYALQNAVDRVHRNNFARPIYTEVNDFLKAVYNTPSYKDIILPELVTMCALKGNHEWSPLLWTRSLIDYTLELFSYINNDNQFIASYASAFISLSTIVSKDRNESFTSLIINSIIYDMVTRHRVDTVIQFITGIKKLQLYLPEENRDTDLLNIVNVAYLNGTEQRQLLGDELYELTYSRIKQLI